MKVQLIRHATVIISIGGKRILVDPMLSNAASMPTIKDVPNQNPNPLVELPINVDNIIDCDAVVITHAHSDHFDEAAAKFLPKDRMIFCQLEDEVKIRAHGFINVCPVKDAYLWGDIGLNRTGGNHGHGIIAYKMAPVSGFVINCPGEPVLYITGDTVWCRKVKKAIAKFRPQVIICNCGGAQFKCGRPITMSTKDIRELFKYCIDKKVVAVHMDAWNHCRLSREELERYALDNNLSKNLFIPEDGGVLTFL